MRRLSCVLLAAASLGIAACASDSVHRLAGPPEMPSFDNGQAKVSLCHRTDAGPYVLISVGAPAVPAHMAHGDATPGSSLPDHAGVFSASCSLAVISLDASTSYNTAHAGGGGGAAFTDACPAGSVGVGMDGYSGSYYGWAAIWGYQLQCQQLRADGTLGTSSTTARHASNYGQTVGAFSGTCASSQVLVGASGAWGQYVTSIGGSCASISTVLANGAAQSSIGPWTSWYANWNIPWSLPCNAGYVITGLAGSSGDILDATGYTCTKVVETVT